MKILILTEEDRFYLPLSINHILANCKHEIVGAYVLENPTTSSTWNTIKKFISAFGVLPLFTYALKLVPSFLDSLVSRGKSPKYSVKNTIAHYDADYLYVDDVNSSVVLDTIKRIGPDLIVTISPTQILKKEILAIPPKGCINVHSSPLPKYRGLYPVFWAMANNDEQIGISVHRVDEGIDTGAVLMTSAISLRGIKTMDEALKRSKVEGARLMLEVVDRIAEDYHSSTPIDISEGSYHSFPDRESYARFKAAGYRLW